MEKIGSTDKASNLELDSHDLNESIDGDEAQHEAKLNLMRQRFLALKAEQEKEEKTMGHLSPLASGKDPSLVETPNIPMPRPFPVHVAADINWKRLKQTIVTASASPVRTNLGPLSPVEGNGGEESEEVEPKEEEGVAVEHNPEVFLDYWKQMKAGSPSSASFQLQSSFPLDMNDIKIDEAAGGELFLQDFEQTAKSSALEIRRIPEEVIHKKREEMEVIQAEEQRLAAERRIKEEAELVWREHGARIRIRDLEAEMWRKIQLEKRKLAEIASEREQLLSWQFRRAREVLEDGLVKQSGEIQERYGRVAVDTASRLYDVKSTQTPHPIEMRIHILRAVKNKLPKGAYVLMLTMYDRLGGQPLTWSELGSFGFGSHRPGVTRPVKHYGRYFDRLMRIEDSVFALCPPRRELKPSNVFVIELFRLANRSNPKDDAIVGWTALPMCLENLSIVEGKYKLPLMRGQHTTSTEHFRDMERNISHDLNNWLCNIYLEIRHLPLDTIESKGQVDYSFIKKQLQVKVVSKNSYLNEILYAEKPAKKSIKDGKLARNDEVDLELGQLQAVDGVDTDLNQKEAPVELPLLGVFQRKSHKKTTGISEKRHLQLGESSRKPLQQQDGEEDDEEEKDDEITSECDCEVVEKGYKAADDFFLHPEIRGKLAGYDAIISSEDKLWAGLSMEEGNKVIRRHQSDGSRYDSLAINGATTLPSHLLPLYRQASFMSEYAVSYIFPPWPALDSEREMERYSMALVQDPAQKRKVIPTEIVRSKFRYLMFEVMDGFSYSDRWTFDFYIAILVMLAALWLRMFVHFIGEYLTLEGIGTPVYGFTVYPYLVAFKYMSSALSVGQEVLVVISGPLINIGFFLTLELLCIFTFRYAGHLPDNASRFVVAYGFCTVFDPFLVMLVDLCAHNFDCTNASSACHNNYVSNDCHCYEGDFVKLWNRFKREEASGVVGGIIVVILYSGAFVLSSFLLYEYLMYVHKDARILDLWRRITANEEEFFMPHDFEISYEELLRICGVRMSRWRGLDGSTRRLVVTKYDDEEENVKETALEGKQKGDRHAELRQHTTHYAIYEHSVDNKKKKLYRHFLMLSEGAVIEIFDKHQPVVAPRASADDEEVRDTGADLVVSRDIMNSYKQSVKR